MNDEYRKKCVLTDGTEIEIRPISPEDQTIETNFINQLSEQSKYYRFMQVVHKASKEMVNHFITIDYFNEMAFIALTKIKDINTEIGVGRYVRNQDNESCEFAIVVADYWHSKGVGTELMKVLIKHARDHGLKIMKGEIFSINSSMIKFIRDLGFTIHPCKDDARIVEATLDLY
jgi:acetyltransferase